MNAPQTEPLAAPASVPEGDAAQSNTAALAKAIAEILPLVLPVVQAAFATQPGGKPGYKTTEFWLTACGVGLNVWGAFSGFVKPETALLVGGILTAAYTLARAVVKSAPQPLSQSSSKPNGAQGEPATGPVTPFETKAKEENAQ